MLVTTVYNIIICTVTRINNGTYLLRRDVKLWSFAASSTITDLIDVQNWTHQPAPHTRVSHTFHTNPKRFDDGSTPQPATYIFVKNTSYVNKGYNIAVISSPPPHRIVDIAFELHHTNISINYTSTIYEYSNIMFILFAGYQIIMVVKVHDISRFRKSTCKSASYYHCGRYTTQVYTSSRPRRNL